MHGTEHDMVFTGADKAVVAALHALLPHRCMESVPAELHSKSHVQAMQGQAAAQQDAHGIQEWG